MYVNTTLLYFFIFMVDFLYHFHLNFGVHMRLAGPRVITGVISTQMDVPLLVREEERQLVETQNLEGIPCCTNYHFRTFAMSDIARVPGQSF